MSASRFLPTIDALEQSARAEVLPPLEELLQILQREMASDPARAAELKVRAALLLWDGRGQAEAALRLLAGVDHPVAHALRLQAAVEAADPAALRACADEILRHDANEEAVELGELLLLRGEPARAAALLERAREVQRPLRALALCLAGRHPEAVEVLAAGAEPQGLLVAAHLCEDRLADGERARTLLRRLLERPGLEAAAHLAALERLLDLEARRSGEAGRIELLRRELELLGGLAQLDEAAGRPRPAQAALMQVALLLGQSLERTGTPQGSEASAPLLAAVHRFCAGSTEGAAELARLLALRLRARCEAGCGHPAEAAALFAELGDRLCERAREGPAVLAELGRAHIRRAAELLAARVPGGRARALYERLFAEQPADEALAWSLEHLLRQAGEATAAARVLRRHAEAIGTPGARLRAARAAEAVGDETAVRELLSNATDRAGLETLCRVLRRGRESAALCAAYLRLGQLQAPPGSAGARRAATYLSVAAALALEALPAPEAEALLAQAEAREGGLLVRLSRLLLLRMLGRRQELAPAVAAVLPLVTSPQTRADLERLLAHTVLEQGGDPEQALRHYERALQARPEDVVALAGLGLLRQDTHPAEALGLLRHAADAAQRLPEGGRATALLLCEVGALHERAQAAPLAMGAYEEALRHDPRCRPAAEALARLRRAGPLQELVPALERLLLLVEEPEQRGALLREIGRCAEALAAGDTGEGPAGGELTTHYADRASLAYARALTLEPTDAEALAGLERLTRRRGRWDLLLQALDRAPRTPGVLHLLCEASERLGRWQDLAGYQEEALAQERDPQQVLQAAQKLADLYACRLGQPEAATRAWARAYQVDPEATLAQPGVADALAQLFEREGRWGDLAGLWGRQLEGIERQLAATPAEQGDAGAAAEQTALRAQRRALLLRLGAVRRDHLQAPQEAAAAFEQVLRDHPEDPEALAALSTVYTAEERSGELRRVLELRARATSDPLDRAHVLLQAGEVAEKAGDIDGARAHYEEAFRLDPSNRGAFTALERMLYRQERWDEVMQMYEVATRLVEEHRSRAYRLGDLYARRGQVLLQYLQRPAEAAVAYLRALETDPDNDTTQAALERIYVANSDWAGLIACYEKRAQLLRDDGKRVEVLRRAARVAAAKLRDLAEAIRLYGKLHAVDPTDAEALDALERHYERAREHDKLLGVLATRLALSTSDADAAAIGIRMAHIYEEGLLDHERAIEAYRQVLERQPSHREALDGLARLFEGSERWAELIEVSRRQIRLTTDRAQKALLYFKCGSVMEAKFGKEDDAIRYYEAAVKTSPSCLPAVHGLRDIYLRRQDWPRVTQTLELEAKLWTEPKERAGIYAHIGQIYREKLGDLGRAIQYYESALAVDRECLPANRALFDVYFERGDWARAEPLGQLLSAKINREGDPLERSEFYRRRAIVAEHTQDRRTAAESLVMALEIHPENLAALELLVGLCRRDSELFDFAAIFRELEKLYRRRGPERALGLTLVARAVLAERNCEVEEAEQLLTEAVRLAPGDYAVTEALCVFYEKLRRFSMAERALRDFIAGQGARAEDVARAQLRLAEMFSEAAMEPEAAAAVLRELLAAGPAVPPELLRLARFRLVQELYVLERYPEARREMEQLIEEAAAPPAGATAGSMAPPEELARYYDYLGRIQEALGESPAAQRSYRRAVDLDPAYAQPVLALARRAAAAGDRAQAELLIRDALAQAQQRGDPHEELRLRRGVARLLSSIDPMQAIGAYRQAIQLATELARPEGAQATHGPEGWPEGLVARETLDDRVAVADLLMQLGDVGAAQAELQTVLQRDLRHAPAHRLLAQAFEHLGEIERAQRVQAVLALLGYAEPMLLGAGRATFRPSIRRGTLQETDRVQHLVPPAMRGPYLELFQALAEQLERELPPPWPRWGETVSAHKVADAGFKVCLADVMRLYATEVEVLVARGVPGGVLALEPAAPNGPPRLLWEAALLDRPDGERRFLLGRALEPVRGGYAVALRLRPAERDEVARLLRTLLLPEGEWDPVARAFYRSLPRRAQRTVERLMGTEPPGPPEHFLAALSLCADRAGLLACDDVAAAIRVLGRLQGEELAVVDGTGGGVLVGQVAGAAALIRFFLSDAYHALRAAVQDGSRLSFS
ncbi:MAG: hypothetical protein RMK29_20030 [Myxococcales bacterium]|nr:hypothetical protein [Myxococcales bacterium]